MENEGKGLGIVDLSIKTDFFYFLFFFFFKQKTAYEIGTGDWSSDVCSSDLLKRLDFLDDNEVEAVFVMIGINDLIWGKTDEEILANYKEIVRRLKAEHPETQIVVQSILPHGGEQSTWESRDKLEALGSDRIMNMNNALKQIATANKAYYLDLYPIFVTGDGTLRNDLTTDGLHLNRQGYLVWRSAIALYAQLELQ